MTYPSGAPAETAHSYLRSRMAAKQANPPTQISFSGIRTSMSSQERYQLGGGGALSKASELIWIDLSNYGGSLDIVDGDVIRELDTQQVFVVVAVEVNGHELKITASVTRRSTG